MVCRVMTCRTVAATRMGKFTLAVGVRTAPSRSRYPHGEVRACK